MADDTNKIKVCFVVPKAYPLFDPEVKEVFGGAEVDVYLLGTELAKDDKFDVSFVTADYGQQETEQIKGVEIIKSLTFRENKLSGAIKIWRAMKKADADIYLLKTASPGVPLAAMFCKLKGKKFVYRTAHSRECDGTYIKSHPLLGKSFVWGLKKAATVLSQNVEDAKALERTAGVQSKVIANGHRLGEAISSQKESVLWVARSAEFKRPNMFVELAEKNPDRKFVMVCPRATGDDKYDSLLYYAKGVSNLEFHERVDFLEIDKFFARAKVFVNTSTAEGFANTFIQACKNSTAILSLAVDPDKFLEKHSCGLCCKDNMGNLQQGLEFLLDEDRFVEIGQSGRQYVENKHDVSKVVEEYKVLFTEMV